MKMLINGGDSVEAILEAESDHESAMLEGMIVCGAKLVRFKPQQEGQFAQWIFVLGQTPREGQKADQVRALDGIWRKGEG